MPDQTSVEAWINLLGPEGISAVIKQAKDRPFITEIHRFSEIRLELHTVGGGRQKTIAELKIEPVLRISVAGTWVPEVHWTDEFGWRRDAQPGESIEFMHRLWSEWRGRLRKDGVLIMPNLPPTGWYTKELQRQWEPLSVLAYWYRSEFESRLLVPGSSACLGLAVGRSDNRWSFWSSHDSDHRYANVADRASAEAALQDIWKGFGFDIMPDTSDLEVPNLEVDNG